MPISDKKKTDSPFVDEGRASRKKKALIVVSLLAGISFFFMIYGLYLNFWRSNAPEAVFHLKHPAVLQKSSLINPQPPAEKNARPERRTEGAELIEKLEKEKKTADETAAALQQIEGETTDRPAEQADIPEQKNEPEKSSGQAEEKPLLPSQEPESEQVKQLHKEQDTAEQAKLSEIEKLREEQKKQEDEKIQALDDLQSALDAFQDVKTDMKDGGRKPPAVPSESRPPAAPPVAAPQPGQENSVDPNPADPGQTTNLKDPALPEKQAAENKTEENKSAVPNLKAPEAVFPARPASRYVSKEVPPPALIKTTLTASLPNFSTIKKGSPQLEIPLHIITPLPELQKESRYGKLPVKAKTGNTPLQSYSRPVSAAPSTPYIAILFSGLGKRENATESAVNALPPEVSLSFSPYSEKLETYITEARRAGHETLLDLPMQQGFFPETDPGPLGLVTGLPEQENRKRLHKTMGMNVAYIGLTAAPNENFSYSGSQMKPFAEEIEESGLLYIGGTDDERMPAFKNTLRPDIHISNNFYRTAIRARLDEVKEKALKNGSAFLRVETVPITLLTVSEWIKSFEPESEETPREITFVPLSFYAKQKSEGK